MGFETRDLVEELMDDPSRPEKEVAHALRVLGTLNRITLSRRIVAKHLRRGSVLDVGTGGADIPGYLLGRGYATAAVGLDVNSRMLHFARKREPGARFAQGDAIRLPFRDKSFDTAVCHLFLHHLPEDRAVALLAEMNRVARRVVVVDLLRRRRLWWWVFLLTRFSTSELIRRDGPASVRRSFNPDEARELASKAGLRARLAIHCFHRFSLVTDGVER